MSEALNTHAMTVFYSKKVAAMRLRVILVMIPCAALVTGLIAAAQLDRSGTLLSVMSDSAQSRLSRWARVPPRGSSPIQVAPSDAQIIQLQLNESIEGTIEDFGDKDWYQIELSADQRAFVHLEKPEGAWDTWLGVRWGQLPDEYNEETVSSYAWSDDLLLIPSTQQGTYYIALCSSGGETGKYRLTVQDSLPQLSLNTAQEGEIATDAQVDWYQIELLADQRVLVHLEKPEGAWGSWLGVRSGQLPGDVYYDWDEETLSSYAWTDDLLLIPSTQAGSYYIAVRCDYLEESRTGKYRLTVTDSLPELVLEQSQAGELQPSPAVHYYFFHAQAGQHLFVMVDKEGEWWSTLGVRYGDIPDYWGGEGTFSESDSGDMALEIPYAQEGYYYLALQAEDTGGRYVIRVTTGQAVGPVVSGVQPYEGGNTGTWMVIINGQYFQPGATVKLTRADHEDIVGQYTVVSANGSEAVSTFDLTGADPGQWDVVVVNPDGQSGRLVDGFTVQAGGEGQFELPLCTPKTIFLRSGDLVWYNIQVSPGQNYFLTIQPKETAAQWTVSMKPEVEYVSLGTEWYEQIFQVKNVQHSDYLIGFSADQDSEAVVRVCTDLPVVNIGELFVGTIYHDRGCDWTQMDVPDGLGALEFTVETVGTISNLNVWRGSFGSDEHWQAESFEPPIKLTIPDPESGRYYLCVCDHGLFEGSQIRDYSILVEELKGSVWPTAIEANGPWILHINAEGVPGVQQFIAGASVKLLGSGGETLEGRDVTIGPGGASLTVVVDSLGATPMWYDLEVVNGDSASGSITYAIEVLAAQLPVIADIAPTALGDTQVARVSITGQHLNPFAAVKLVGEGWEDIIGTATGEGKADGTEVIAELDLRGRPVGLWDVVVVNPDGREVTAPSALEVVRGGSPRVWIDIVGPRAVRAGISQQFSIVYGNSGEVDIYDVLIFVSVPQGVEYRLDLPPFPLHVEGLDWNEVPQGVLIDSEILIPIWIYELGAGFNGVLRLNLTPPGDMDEVFVKVAIVLPPDTAFSRTGDFTHTAYHLDLLAASLAEPLAEVMPSSSPSQVHPRRAVLQQRLYEEMQNAVEAMGPAWVYAATIALPIMGYGVVAIVAYTGGPALATAVVIGLVWGGLQVYTLNSVGNWAERAKDRELGARVVRSYDPNVKLGAKGFGPTQFVTSRQNFHYVIHYENDPEKATAPAAEVRITDQLHSNLDWSTYQITGINIGDVSVPVPANSQTLSTTVPAVVKLKDITDPNYPNCPPQDTDVNIEVNCEFNAAKGEARWHFIGRDPSTGELADFLPPNVFEDDPGTAWDDRVAPHGGGWVSFTIKPTAGLPTSTRIENTASIVFDVNPPMDTPVVFNTIDSGPPVGQVEPLAAAVATEFTVKWSGEDDENGSGIGSYTIYVSDDGGAYQAWLANTTDTSATFTAEAQHTYAFYSVARDNVGNQEAAPDQPDTTTTVGVVTHTFSAGQRMVGIPGDVADSPMMEDLLGIADDKVGWWDPLGPGYVTFDGPTDYALGRGYWAQFAEDTQIEVPGIEITGEFAYDVRDGWNIVSSSYTSEIGLESITGAPTLRPFAWTDQGTGYELVAPITDSLNMIHNTLKPWWGYWVLSQGEGTITWNPTSPTAQDVELLQIGRADAENGGWQIQLTVRAGNRVDLCNYCGVADEQTVQAASIANPPAIDESVDLYFPSQAGPMATDIRPTSEGKATWEFEVHTDLADTEVTVAYPDLSVVPNDYRLMLTDLDADKSTYMRTTHGYSYNSGAHGGVRHFRMTAEPESERSLVITGMTTHQVSGERVAIAYTLSATAAVEMQIRNIAGRLIHSMQSNKLQLAGTHSATWNLANSAGSRVPRGTYLCVITARTEEGQQASCLRPIAVHR